MKWKTVKVNQDGVTEIIENDDCLYLAMKNAPEKVVKKPKSKLEADIQKEIVKEFLKDGWQVVRYNSRKFKPDFSEIYMTCYYDYTNGMSKGHPDLEVKKNCECIGIETKTKSGKLSPDQKRYIETSLKQGNIILVMNTVDKAKDFIAHLHNIDNESIKSIALYWKENNAL